MGIPTDHDLDLSVASMLRFGVTLSAIVVFAGGLMYLRHPFIVTPDYQHFQAGTPDLRTLSGIVYGAWKIRPDSLIQLGLLLLIATPITRVAFCVIGFARQKDRLYVLVSALVLLILLFSFARGLRG
jgi:uncharacterized membrane protein